MARVDDTLEEALRYHRAGDLDKADRLYQAILEVRPKDAAAMHFRGLVALQRGDYEAGIPLIAAAIEIDDLQPVYHNNLGEAYRATGNLEMAKACFERALARFPRAAEMHNNLGLTFHALGKFVEARGAFEEAVRLRPDYVQAHHNLGITLQAERRFAEAADCHRRALQFQPGSAASIGALGYSLQQLGRLEEAATEYRRYLELAPQDSAGRFNLATVLHRLRRFEEAETEYDRLAASAPPPVEWLVQMANCAQSLGKLAKAADCFRQAIALDPARDEPHFRLGAALLAAGDFAGGWPEYEWRLKRVARHRSLPAWDGRDLEGKRIVLYAEGGQGFGDTLQFVRYAPLVSQRGGEVVLDVQPTLVKLLVQSGFNQVVADVPTIDPPCDYQAAMMSLPGIFGTDLDSIPAEVPYLRAQGEAVAAWAAKLRPYPGFKIGIHWHGSPIAVGDGRVFPLQEFEGLARLPGIHLFSMQLGPAAAELSSVASTWPLTDLSAALNDFHDSAAITSNFDLVITSDSALAHLAGALGKPVWVALPYSAEWRWLTNRDDSPWYPTMRLFRQARVNDWSGAFDRMAAELTRLIANRQNA